MPDTARSEADTTTDHEEIRRWVEERDGKPAIVKSTHDKKASGILRIEFPGYKDARDENLAPIDWKEFFAIFEKNHLAFLYQDRTSSGETSRFFKFVDDLLVFRSMRGSQEVMPLAEDYPCSETAVFDDPAFPRMGFVERRYADDPTNWWVPNRAAVEAMLRSSGFRVIDHPEEEVFICRCASIPDAEPRAVYPARGSVP